MGHFVVSADYFGSEDSPKMGHFVVSSAVNVRVGKNIKQPAGRGEYRSDIYYIYIGSGHYVVVADRRRCHIVRL